MPLKFEDLQKMTRLEYLNHPETRAKLRAGRETLLGEIAALTETEFAQVIARWHGFLGAQQTLEQWAESQGLPKPRYADVIDNMLRIAITDMLEVRDPCRN